MRILPTLVFIAFSACIANAQIVGSWQNNEYGHLMTVVFNADGSGTLDGEAIKYSVKGTTLTVTTIADDATIDYKFTQSPNLLTITGGDLEEPLKLTKASIKSQSSDKAILGVWSGNNESMEFKADGNCLYASNTFQYTASGGQIKLTTQQGVTVIPYTIKNGNLVINVNGQDYTYTKGPLAKQVSNGKRSVPQELVGKWCWVNVTSSYNNSSSSDACITLNADGTYAYYSERSTSGANGGTNSQGSDRGAWWVEGNRIFYDSPSRGQGSYALEKRNHPKNVNDPMIVLDGEPYVTQIQKAPWR